MPGSKYGTRNPNHVRLGHHPPTQEKEEEGRSGNMSGNQRNFPKFAEICEQVADFKRE